MSEPRVGFERLDRRLVMVAAAIVGGIAVMTSVPTAFALYSGGISLLLSLLVVLVGSLLLVALTSIGEYLRWRATRFRVTADRFELTFELVVTKRRSLARERIRTVDVTANPVQRLFGLAAVVIGTGQHTDTGDPDIKLDPVSRQRADELRVLLLRREREVTGPSEHDGPLATVDWRWAAYAPLSFLTPALGAAAIGAVFNVSGWFGWDEGDAAALLGDFVRTAAVYGTLVVAFGVIAVGAVGALLLFVEMWWGYRLQREPGGTVRVTRGLLTTRSISIEERRLRGVEVVEPFGIRLVRAARVDAVATGMRQDTKGQRTDHKTLLPAAPLRVVDRVAASVLRVATSPTRGRLRPHPRAALGRRMRWAMAPVIAVFAMLLVLSVVVGSVVDGFLDDALGGMVGALPWIFAAVAVPIAIALGWDAYRNLGHGISGDYLLVRRGALRRSTVALQRSGVIGWTVRQSIFQRRADLITLIATTAAGNGGYQVPDVGVSDGLMFADDAVPGLLTPFLASQHSRE
ncbi:MAG: PH domain-containing protein [Haloechinothrix sp.]